MKIPRCPLTLTVATIAVALSFACGPAAEETAPAETASESATESEDVEYEPAYPEDVSDEGLTATDAEQQGEHTHADGTTHEHDEDDDEDEGNHDS